MTEVSSKIEKTILDLQRGKKGCRVVVRFTPRIVYENYYYYPNGKISYLLNSVSFQFIERTLIRYEEKSDLRS